ncbi:MAG: hypothetical protein AAFR56_22175 [Chloroflexota bacterium]
MNWRNVQSGAGIFLLMLGIMTIFGESWIVGMIATLAGFYLLARVFAQNDTIEAETTTHDDESGQIERE